LRLQMRGELRRMQQELGMTFIHVTHTQMEAIAVADIVVVMDHGHIEQAGTAQEIYSAPDSAYVARFMGGQNVLSGKVSETGNGKSILVSENGNRFELSQLSRAESKPASERVYFAIRRDHVELIRAGASQSATGEINTVIGTVSAIEYQGTAVKVTVQGVTSEDFVAYVPDARFLADPLDRGDRVVARWSTDEARPLKVGTEQTTYRGH
jgi:putative spermidine/putrescine transport system ATP-binding protein